MNLLKGNGTYLVAVVLFILGGLKALGYVDEGIYNMAFGLLVPTGIFTLRRALK